MHRAGLELHAEGLQLGEQGLLRTRRAVLGRAHRRAAQHDLQQPPLLAQVAAAHQQLHALRPAHRSLRRARGREAVHVEAHVEVVQAHVVDIAEPAGRELQQRRLLIEAGAEAGSGAHAGPGHAREARQPAAVYGASSLTAARNEALLGGGVERHHGVDGPHHQAHQQLLCLACRVGAGARHRWPLGWAARHHRDQGRAPLRRARRRVAAEHELGAVDVDRREQRALRGPRAPVAPQTYLVRLDASVWVEQRALVQRHQSHRAVTGRKAQHAAADGHKARAPLPRVARADLVRLDPARFAPATRWPLPLRTHADEERLQAAHQPVDHRGESDHLQ